MLARMAVVAQSTAPDTVMIPTAGASAARTPGTLRNMPRSMPQLPLELQALRKLASLPDAVLARSR